MRYSFISDPPVEPGDPLDAYSRAVMFVAETTGQPGFVVPGILAAVVAELLMGNRSVTRYQQEPAS